MYSINSANIHTWQMGSDSQVASIPTFPHQILFLTENQLNRVQNRNSGSLQSLTVGQRQRLLQLLQVIGSLCDHHTDCILNWPDRHIKDTKFEHLVQEGKNSDAAHCLFSFTYI